jgi:hypothetical protein
MTDEWGPWIVHDGRPCPCFSWDWRYAHKRFFYNGAWIGPIGKITLYQIRRPEALRQLVALVENITERDRIEACS